MAEDPYSHYCDDKQRNIDNYLEHPELSQQQKDDLRGFYEAFCLSPERKMKVPTQEGYIRSVGLFGLWLKKDYARVTQKDIEDYFKSMSDRGESVRDWAKLAVKVFYRWKLTKKTSKGDPFPELVSWMKISYKKQTHVKKEDVLSADESKRMIDHCKTLRDRALISLLLDTGLRAGEAAAIRLGDIELSGEDPYIEITHSKTEDKEGLRRVYLVDSLHDVAAWITQHPLKKNKKAFLFIPRRGKGDIRPREYMTNQTIYAAIQSAAKKAGIEKKVWTHLFRHTAATNVAVIGMSADMMNKSFGWSADSRMASRYGHLSSKDAAHFRKRVMGIEVKGDMEQKAKECWRCSRMNAWHEDVCICGATLDASKAKHEKITVQKQLETMQARLAKLEGGRRERVKTYKRRK